MLLTFSPATKFGPAYFRAIAEVIAAGGPPDVTKVRTIMEHYGLTLAKP